MDELEEIHIRLPKRHIAVLEILSLNPTKLLTSKRTSYGAKTKIISHALDKLFKEIFTMTNTPLPEGLPNVADMDPKERQAEALAIRQRVNNGEDVSVEELNRGLLLIREERRNREGVIPKKKVAKKKKPEVKAFSLDDL